MTDQLAEVEPSFIPVSDGSWLAVAGPGDPLNVGVLADTQAEARIEFLAAYRLIAALTDPSVAGR